MPNPPDRSDGEADHTHNPVTRRVEGESQEPEHLHQAPIPGPTPIPGRPGETLPTPVDPSRPAEELLSTKRELPGTSTHQTSLNLEPGAADSAVGRQAGPLAENLAHGSTICGARRRAESSAEKAERPAS